MKHEPIGSSFESFLEDEGIRDEVEAVAQKRVFAWQVRKAMEASGITHSEMAERMRTSRSQVARLLDPDNTSGSARYPSASSPRARPGSEARAGLKAARPESRVVRGAERERGCRNVLRRPGHTARVSSASTALHGARS